MVFAGHYGDSFNTTKEVEINNSKSSFYPLPPSCKKLSTSQVRFSAPLMHYVENFLNFPVGMAVPTGYYNRQKATWVPSDNGRVVKILSITGGLADLDTDGDGTADNGPSLGV